MVGLKVLWGLVWRGATVNGEDFADQGQAQTFHYSSGVPERESLRLVDTVRELLGHLAHLLPLQMKKLSYGGEK